MLRHAPACGGYPAPQDDTEASLAPRRLDAVHARVGDELAEVLVEVAGHAERRLDDRAVASPELLRAGDLCRIDRRERLFRVRESLLQMLEHLLLGGHRLELLKGLAAAADEWRWRRTVRHRREHVELTRDVHERLAHGSDACRRPPGVLVSGKCLSEREELALQRVEIANELLPDPEGRVTVRHVLRGNDA